MAVAAEEGDAGCRKFAVALRVGKAQLIPSSDMDPHRRGVKGPRRVGRYGRRDRHSISGGATASIPL